MTEETKPARVGTLSSLRAAVTSKRIGAVTLQSFASGLPLGLIWIALPAWLTYRGVDIKTVGLFSLAQAPWTFKFLWAPLMDRYSPRFLGRKRSWILITQLFLFGGIVLLAIQGGSPRVGTVAAIAMFIAFCSASQDIAIDGYAVEVLERREQGLAVGARVAFYRAAVLLSGAVSITLGERFGWPLVLTALALLYIPLAAVVVFSPEPEVPQRAPLSLRQAVFEPLIDIFRRSRALQIVAFLLLYKFGENLATALTRPFLIQKCYSPEDVGLATASIGLVAIIAGTFFGGLMTERVGLGRALWIFGLIQAVGFFGYILVDRLTPGSPCAGGVLPTSVVQPLDHRLVMYAAIGIENACQGMATGAFGVLLLRITQKQFSATQYALFSSVFALGRTLAGPPAGFLVDAVGWTPFFILCTLASVPGLVLLQRFVPLGVREPEFWEEARVEPRPVARAWLAVTSGLAAILGTAGAAVTSVLLAALKAIRMGSGSLDLSTQALRVVRPTTPSDWIRISSFLVFGLLAGVGTAALVAARRGVRPSREAP